MAWGLGEKTWDTLEGLPPEAKCHPAVYVPQVRLPHIALVAEHMTRLSKLANQSITNANNDLP